VPAGTSHVRHSTASRPACTPGSFSASALASSIPNAIEAHAPKIGVGLVLERTRYRDDALRLQGGEVREMAFLDAL
jgi:hypothetical protein